MEGAFKALTYLPLFQTYLIIRDTRCFSTKDASGSTSQAANILEAVEVGADVLLIDEDTSATNFMIRDQNIAGISI